jgi:electron transfer flavoprotein beta subunit
LAKGVDQVFRIDGQTNLPERIAMGLIPALRELAPQIVLVGVQSEDWMGGEVGVYLAEGLGASIGFAVVEITELNDAQVRIKKEIGGSRNAEVILKLPAVLCVQSGIQPLQYVSALRRKKVRDTPIKLWGKLEDIDMPNNMKNMMNYQFKEVTAPEAETQATIIAGERPEKAKALLEILRKNLSV